jgi:hypothetical protein
MKDTKDKTSSSGPETGVEERIRKVGEELSQSLSDLIGSLPGAPHRPTQLARDLGVNRAVASRVLGATSKKDALDCIHHVPGPEPLRKLVRAAKDRGVSPQQVVRAMAAIDSFDHLIRSEAGTRPALDALISSRLPGARERFELASKYSVFKGLSQLKGVQAETWLGTAIVGPNSEDSEKHDLTWINGAVAMQRLRPGVTARFSYRARRSPESIAKQPSSEAGLGLFPLDEFCSNPPAKLKAWTVGQTVHYVLPDNLLGPQDLVDMFVVDHHPAALERHSIGENLRLTSLFVEPAMPVANLVFDVLLHDDAFPGSTPELIVYDTSHDGLPDANDSTRDIDRVSILQNIELLGHDMRDLRANNIPTYSAMLSKLSDRFGWDPSEFRGYRASISYPVYGWQICLAFERPRAK